MCVYAPNGSPVVPHRPTLFHFVPICSLATAEKGLGLVVESSPERFSPLPRKEACVEGIWKLYVCGADPLTANDEALSAEHALFSTLSKM